ncbi:MAG: hypothetical protein AAFZ58_11575 [Pseudomonadota bacterium]
MTDVLRSLQNQLEAIYALDAGPDVRDFLIDAAERQQHLAADDRRPDESVLLRESADGVDLAVYLAGDVLTRLTDDDPLQALTDDVLADLWLAIEGVSHFSYLVHRLHRDSAVSLLELELQAEIDKFVATWWLARAQGHRDVREGLWRRLFVDTALATNLSAEEAERYSTASRYASYFCAELGLFGADSHDQAVRELRHFYRLDQPAKFSEIHSQRLTS